MNKIPLAIPISIEPFAQHKELKAKILFEILNQQKCSTVADKDDSTNITRCDWNGYSRDQDRAWVKTIMPHMSNHLTEWSQTLGYKSFIVRDLWFQQYAFGSEHDWHIHGCNWTGVYYLDLPDGSLKTQFKDPMDTNNVNEFEVKEGDILIFPSFVIHKAPKNMNVRMKTIISWNMDTELKEL